MSIGKFIGFVERGQAARRGELGEDLQLERPRMMYAGQCDEHGGYPGDALNRPQLADLSICMTCGALGLFKGEKRGGRLLPSAIAGVDEIEPPLSREQNFMLVQILDAIKNRRAARAAAAH